MTFQRRIHRLLSPLIYRDGLALVPSNLAGHWSERQFIRRLINRLNVDCVIDVGANVGQYARDLRLIGFGGTILSFEPDPTAFAKLRAASEHDCRWHVFNHALGDTRNIAELNIMKQSVFNSFRQPSRAETRHFAEINQVVSTIDVQVERLDAMLPDLHSRYGFKRPFLKTDTQGFDLEVLRGASGVCTEIVGIQCELAIQRLYEKSPVWTDALAEYGAAGFELVGVFPVHPLEPFLIECDCFFQRRPVA